MKWSILVPILVCAVVATNPASADMIRGVDIDFVLSATLATLLIVLAMAQ
jgi:hypothetical protein